VQPLSENAVKIGQTPGKPVWEVHVRADNGRSPAAPAPAASSPKTTLSALSSQLQALEARLTDGGGFDAARVEALKEAIRSGQFKVDTDIVADRLIASVRELIDR
jgi:negative regulator of flagellin synthesis FlgM